jgi:hypothetical protein
VATGSVFAQTPTALKPYICEDAPVLALDHVRVVDGTGAIARFNPHFNSTETSLRSRR